MASMVARTPAMIDARAPEEAREHVAPQLARAKKVGSRAVREQRVVVGCIRVIRSDPGGKRRSEHERERDDQAEDRERAPEESLADQSPAARTAGHLDCDAGIGVGQLRAPATRMRGLRTE